MLDLGVANDDSDSASMEAAAIPPGEGASAGNDRGEGGNEVKVEAVVAEPSRSEPFSRGGSSPISTSVFCCRFIPTTRSRSTQLK